MTIFIIFTKYYIFDQKYDIFDRNFAKYSSEIFPVRLHHIKSKYKDYVYGLFQMLCGPVHVECGLTGTDTHSDFSIGCMLLRLKLAENVPEMCRN